MVIDFSGVNLSGLKDTGRRINHSRGIGTIRSLWAWLPLRIQASRAGGHCHLMSDC